MSTNYMGEEQGEDSDGRHGNPWEDRVRMPAGRPCRIFHNGPLHSCTLSMDRIGNFSSPPLPSPIDR